MAGLSISGIYKGATAIKTVGQNNSPTCNFYVDITGWGQQENHAEFQLFGDKTALIQNLEKGQEVKVYFDIRGRKVAKKDGTGENFFQNLNAWKIEKVTRESAALAKQPSPEPITGGGKDDLPF